MSVPSSNDPLSINSVQSFKNADTGQIQTKAEGTLNGHSIKVYLNFPDSEKGVASKMSLNAEKIKTILKESQIVEVGKDKTTLRYENYSIEIEHKGNLKNTFKDNQGQKLGTVLKPGESSFLTKIGNTIGKLLPQNYTITAKDVNKHSPGNSPRRTEQEPLPPPPKEPPPPPPGQDLPVENLPPPPKEPPPLPPLEELPVEHLEIEPIDLHKKENAPAAKAGLMASSRDLMPRRKDEEILPKELQPLLSLLKAGLPKNLNPSQASEYLESIKVNLNRAKNEEEKGAILDLFHRFENDAQVSQVIKGQIVEFKNSLRESTLKIDDQIKALVNYSGSLDNNKFIRNLSPNFDESFIELHKWSLPTSQLLEKLKALEPLTDQDRENIAKVQVKVLESYFKNKIRLPLTQSDLNEYIGMIKYRENRKFEKVPSPQLPVTKPVSKEAFFKNIVKSGDSTRLKQAALFARDCQTMIETMKSQIGVSLSGKNALQDPAKKDAAKSSEVQSPQLTNVINYQNQLSTFIREQILKYPDNRERGRCIDFFIKAREEALKLNDLETAVAINTALQFTDEQIVPKVLKDKITDKRLESGGAGTYPGIRKLLEKLPSTATPINMVIKTLAGFSEVTGKSAAGYSKLKENIPDYSYQGEIRENLELGLINEIVSKPPVDDKVLYEQRRALKEKLGIKRS